MAQHYGSARHGARAGRTNANGAPLPPGADSNLQSGCSRPHAAGARRARSGKPSAGGTARDHGARLRGQQALALHALADELAGAAHGLGPLAGLLLRRLLVMAAELHLAEDAFALHLLLQGAERLIDIVVPNKNLHASSSSVLLYLD